MFKCVGIVAVVSALVFSSAVRAEGRVTLPPEPAPAQDTLPPHNEADLPKIEGLTAKQVAVIATAIALASIAVYRREGPGPCACPNDVDRAGRRCGKRSARDRPGGFVVYCYLTDVPVEMIKARAQATAAKAPK